MKPLIELWYFHLPNFVLAAVMYTLVGRLVLSWFAPPDWQNYIWRAFVRITDPALTAARFLAPLIVPPSVVMIFAVLWIMLARVMLFAGLAWLGLLPTLTTGAG
jgi:uncharacterized protein YggT (Ycf19 family)